MNFETAEQKDGYLTSSCTDCAQLIAFDHFPDIITILSADGIIYRVNKHFEKVLECVAKDICGRQFHTIVLPDDRQGVNVFLQEVRTTGGTKNFVHRALKEDGFIIYLSWSAYWSEKDGFIVASGKEVTESINTQQKLVAKEQLFQALIENSFDLLAQTDVEGSYLYVSDTINEVCGYKRNELLGKRCFDYIHPDDLPSIFDQYSVLLNSTKKIHVPPYRFKTAKGEWLWMEGVVTNQLNNPDIKGIVISARDIHQRFNNEKKLKEMQLLEALMEGEEKERGRIARDLHDGVSGMIAAAKMHFGSLANQLTTLNDYTGYQQGMNLLETAARMIRKTSHNLMPEILLENGLVEALQRYCNNVSNEQLKVLFFSFGTIERYSPNFELSLYRIAQELISNVIKHSQAAEAIVQLSQHKGTLSLTIEDCGVGFCQDEQQEGTGLNSIRKRVGAMDGRIEIRHRTR